MRIFSLKEIKLTQGQVAIIDDEDYELISQYKWYAHRCGHTFYARTNKTKKEKLSMHSLILAAQKGQEIDHINHNGLDNRRENLRFCTKQHNNANQIKTRGTSRFKGVYWNKTKKKWQAGIEFNSKGFYLGRFCSEEEAARAYDKKALELYGEFACLNFPNEAV